MFLHFLRELDPLPNALAPRTDILTFCKCYSLFCDFYVVVRKIKYALFFNGQYVLNCSLLLWWMYYNPTANLTTFQKGPFYFGIKVFNHLPTSIKNTSDINQLRSALNISFLYILNGGIFCVEFQSRSWLSVIILKVNI